MRWIAATSAVVLALASCGPDDGVTGSALLQEPFSTTPDAVAGPFEPTSTGNNPFAVETPRSPTPAGQSTNPFAPGSEGPPEEDDTGLFELPGGLRDYYCSCLGPGDFVPTLSFHACASNPFEAANLATLKTACILAGGCTGCVCFPGITCLLKG